LRYGNVCSGGRFVFCLFRPSSMKNFAILLGLRYPIVACGHPDRLFAFSTPLSFLLPLFVSSFFLPWAGAPCPCLASAPTLPTDGYSRLIFSKCLTIRSLFPFQSKPPLVDHIVFFPLVMTSRFSGDHFFFTRYILGSALVPAYCPYASRSCLALRPLAPCRD